MENQQNKGSKNVVGKASGIARRGSGLGTGPVGNKTGYGGRPGVNHSSQPQGGQHPSGARPPRPGTPVTPHSSRDANRANTSGFAGMAAAGAGTGKKGGLGRIIVIAAVILIILFLIKGMGGGGGDSSVGYIPTEGTSGAGLDVPAGTTSSDDMNKPSYYSNSPLAALLGYSSAPSGYGSSYTASTVSSGWDLGNNTGSLDTGVADGARAKRTKLLGNGKDTVTIMIYMCGTDLESRSAMASYDLQEMLKASIAENVNILVYTGGCKSWKNSVVSSSVNQIYKVEAGTIKCISADEGSKPMVSPDTLSGFIKFCKKNYSANRYGLIFWDHGGGSISAYGYDEKFASSGSMTLPQIASALKAGGTTFDFIGFDACLMATLETALTVEPYADYLIASEESEPGIGWYYTNWLSKLSADTSLPTTEMGKIIIDDFVTTCAKECAGQKTTLSLIDLAELKATVPDEFSEFSLEAAELLKNDGFRQLSGARASSREFAASSKIDQVDLVHLVGSIKTEGSDELVSALLGAIKYNRTSSNMTNAYGLSVYFPYRSTTMVKNAAGLYSQLGIDEDYIALVKAFAGYQSSGQNAYSASSAASSSSYGSGYSSSYGSGPFDVLSGSGYGSAGAAGSISADDISSLLGALFGMKGLPENDRALDPAKIAEYVSQNALDPSSLVWTKKKGGKVLSLTEEQKALISKVELNVFYDDGEGYIDLGLDAGFLFDEDGALAGEFDGTWFSIDLQPVAFYYLDTVYDENGTPIVSGFVPVLLNGERAELIICFDSEHPGGYIAGARSVYIGGETGTVAKAMGVNTSELFELTEGKNGTFTLGNEKASPEIFTLAEGAQIDFLCDYYSYSGEYLDSYMLGEPWTYSADALLGYAETGTDGISACYRITDIYGASCWSPIMD